MASTVLVVDDDQNDCEFISSELAEHGYETVVTYNGREAMDYLRGPGRKPGLILLDLMMPVMTGWEFRKEQQADPAIADIPVAIITGIPDIGEKAAAVGAVDVLLKPSKVEDLTSLVSRFCK